MGNCGHKQVGVLFIDDDIEAKMGTVGFAPIIFKGTEWEPFKAFCNKRLITQKDLNLAFKQFLSHDEVYIREFRVRSLDARNCFANHSKLMQEIEDTYVPSIFFKEYRGLEKPFSNEEISFARFVVMSYIFCAQPMTDIIYDFLAILRHKLTLKLNAVMFSYNFEEILKVITEEHQHSACLRSIMSICNRKNDQEISIEYLLKIGVKYPLIFYGLARFQKHFRRLLFGDKYWQDKRPLKSRFSNLNVRNNVARYFVSESAATRETARAIIADVMLFPNMPLELNITLTKEKSIQLSEECFFRLKESLGYQLARGLIIESELLPERTLPLLQTPKPEMEDVRMLDDKVGQEFIFNMSTGLRTWVKKFVDEEGSVLKECSLQEPPPEFMKPFQNLENGVQTVL